MNYTLQIQKLLLAIDKATSNEDRIQLTKQAINIADINNDLDWGFELREDLLYLEKGTSQSRESFPAFAWMLETVDNNTDLFDSDPLLQKYRWMVIATQKNSSFSLEQIESIRSDYKKRMEDNGHGLYSYYNTLIKWHIQIGETQKAREYQSLRNSTQPDTISHCKACDLNSDIELELLSGNFDKAISIAEEILSDRETCFYEPLSTSSKLCFYLSLNKDDRAKKYYEKALESFFNLKEYESRLIQDIAHLISYGAEKDTQNAWNLFEKGSEWDIDADDYQSFLFSVCTLPLLKLKQEVELNLSLKLPFFNNDNIYDTSTLHEHYLGRAKTLASKFDNRNNNNYFSHILDKTQNII